MCRSERPVLPFTTSQDTVKPGRSVSELRLGECSESASISSERCVLHSRTRAGVWECARNQKEARSRRDNSATSGLKTDATSLWPRCRGGMQKNCHVVQNRVVHWQGNLPSSKRHSTTLGGQHSHFLLVDNGTVGRSGEFWLCNISLRYGAEIILRRRLESFICENSTVPIICVVLEGGEFTVRAVHEYVNRFCEIYW